MSCEQHHLLTHNPPWAWLLFPLSNLALPFSIIHHCHIIYHLSDFLLCFRLLSAPAPDYWALLGHDPQVTQAGLFAQ